MSGKKTLSCHEIYAFCCLIDVPNVILIFTDGGSTDLPAALEQARLARLSGIVVLVAAVGDWVNMVEVRELASYPDQLNVIAADYEFLPSIETQVKRALCNGK